MHEAEGLPELIADLHTGAHFFGGYIQQLQTVQAVEPLQHIVDLLGIGDAHRGATIAYGRGSLAAVGAVYGGAEHLARPPPSSRPAMTLQEIPPDLRATLALLLGQRQRYDAIAALLEIEERTVHDRAHAALALIAPRQARELSAAQREQVGEYLLGQAPPAEQSAAVAYLESSAAARAWAQALAAELAPLPTSDLPAIPSREAPAGRAPSSRRGGAILLGGLALAWSWPSR